MVWSWSWVFVLLLVHACVCPLRHLGVGVGARTFMCLHCQLACCSYLWHGRAWYVYSCVSNTDTHTFLHNPLHTHSHTYTHTDTDTITHTCTLSYTHTTHTCAPPHTHAGVCTSPRSYPPLPPSPTTPARPSCMPSLMQPLPRCLTSAPTLPLSWLGGWPAVIAAPGACTRVDSQGDWPRLACTELQLWLCRLWGAVTAAACLWAPLRN